jgi:NAD(P)-dependent dehydrogenase (short-subunit alcohol dehydrogenase family)
MALDNRVVMITGATGSLGPTAANRFSEQGANLVLVGSSAEKLGALGQSLELPMERWLAVAVILSQPDAAKKVLDASLEKFGHVDILLHLVGGHIGGKPVPQVTEEEISTMLQQHLWTTFHLAQVLVPHMSANGWGRLLVITSPTAGMPPANSLPYAVGKAAEETLMLTLAEELKSTGVTANILRVRMIDTNHKRDRKWSPKTASWTSPEEVTAMLLHLCSDEAGMINGARIPIYGSP